MRYAGSLATAILAGATLYVFHAFDVYPERRFAFWVLGVIADPETLENLAIGAVIIVAILSAGVFNLIWWGSRKIIGRSSDDDGIAIPASPKSALQMSVGEVEPYFSTAGSVYGIRRTFNLKLENIDPRKSLSNCSVQIQSTSPGTNYGEGPWPLKDGISLAAGQHVFVPLVIYGEAREPDKFPCGDTFMTVGTDTGHPCLGWDTDYALTLRATAPKTAYSEFQCMVWVDHTGRLRVDSRIGDRARISLQDAARQFYEKFEGAGSLIAADAEWDNSPNGVLQSCGGYIVRTKAITLFGKRPPSTLSRKIDPKEVQAMELVDGSKVLKSRHHENSKYIKLQVRVADFEQMVEEVERNEPR